MNHTLEAQLKQQRWIYSREVGYFYLVDNTHVDYERGLSNELFAMLSKREALKVFNYKEVEVI